MHAGLSPTFCGQPLVLDPAELEGADVAVVGAPFDDGTSNRPGARFGPRAITSRWMSDVPSSISSSFASRIHFSTGCSRE